MLESLKGYVQVASGVTEVTRQRAVEVARQALAATPVGGVWPAAGLGREAVVGQASAIADELLEVGREQREQLVQLVRSEVEAVLARLGVGGDARQAELAAQLAASQARVRELERELAAAQTRTARPTRATKRAGAARSTAKRTAARPPTERATTATRTTPGSEPAGTPASSGPAPAKRTAAKRATAKRTTAKRTTAKRAPAAKSTGTTKRAAPGAGPASS